MTDECKTHFTLGLTAKMSNITQTNANCHMVDRLQGKNLYLRGTNRMFSLSGLIVFRGKLL